jgi:hypothetical protein
MNDEANFGRKAYDDDEMGDDMMIGEKYREVIFGANTICETTKMSDEGFRNE